MIYVEYGEFFTIASDNGLSGAFALSAESVLLCLSLLSSKNRTIEFFNEDFSEITDAQKDNIDGWIANAIGELMNEVLPVTNIPAIVKPYAGDILALPEGHLLCDGTAYQRVDYPILYDSLNPAFIVDADHFTVPDLNARVVRGSETNIGITGGSETQALTINQLPSHSHEFVGGNNVYLGLQVDPPPPQILGRWLGETTGAAIVLGNSVASVGAGEAHNNMQPYMNLLYIISTGE